MADGAPDKRQAERDKYRLWNMQGETPKWAPPLHAAPRVSPANALALELQTSKSLAKLRQKLAERVSEAGLRAKVRPLTIERWRFAAIQEEGSVAKKGGAAAHPVLPAATSPGRALAALADDLVLQGLSKDAATKVVEAFAADAAKVCAAATGLVHRAVSGLTMGAAPLHVKFNRHTVEMSVDKAVGVQTAPSIKFSRDVYGKLALLHRRHAPADERAPPLPELAAGEDPDLEEREGNAAAAAAAAGGVGGAAADPRAALHARLFAMLLRYQSIKAAGYQCALGVPVWRVLTQQLGVGAEGFASPLNACVDRRCSPPQPPPPSPPIPTLGGGPRLDARAKAAGTAHAVAHGGGRPPRRYLPAFGTAFPDVDAPFGSRGSFVRLKPASGSFALHPPQARTAGTPWRRYTPSSSSSATRTHGGGRLCLAGARCDGRRRRARVRAPHRGGRRAGRPRPLLRRART